MNRTRALSLLFFLGSTAFSQTTGKQAAPESLLKQFSSAALQANCPIQVKAGLYLTGEVPGAEPIENGRTTERRQRIHITLANPESEVALVQLTVYGFPVGVRVDPAVAYASHEGSPVVHNNPAEIQKTIVFDRAVAAGQSTSIDISVRDFSIVSSIDLNSVTYSDGSSWHPANHKYCQAVGVPTGALPIDGAVIHR
jgi:negative regulator of sigma E activity